MNPIFRLTKAETKLAKFLWTNAPIGSMEMIRRVEAEIGWKKSTTFTNLKFMINKGLAQNINSVVTMRYTEDEFYSEQSCVYVDDTFSGSLPMFVAAFTNKGKLSKDQVAELKKLIDEY